jgi:hypothetical protein
MEYVLHNCSSSNDMYQGGDGSDEPIQVVSHLPDESIQLCAALGDHRSCGTSLTEL